jgi:hypothetical protein
VGTEKVRTVAFVVPGGSVDYWTDRLAGAGVEVDEPVERFSDTVIPLRDPDGVPLELVARADAPAGHPPNGPVPTEHAIRGFFGVTLSLVGAGPTADLLEAMGYGKTNAERDRQRYESDGDLGYVVDLLEDPQAPRGQQGAIGIDGADNGQRLVLGQRFAKSASGAHGKPLRRWRSKAFDFALKCRSLLTSWSLPCRPAPRGYLAFS